MAREPHVALLTTVSGSLARRQILARLSSKHSKTMNISKKRPTKVAICVVFSCYIARIAKLVLNWIVVPCDTDAQLYGSHGKPFLSMRLLWLYKAERFPPPRLSVQTSLTILFQSLYNTRQHLPTFFIFFTQIEMCT